MESQSAACCMGATVRRHMRTRPVFFCSMRPACSRTLRCLRMAGMEMSCGRASSVTEACPRWRVVRIVRRVGSPRAEKVASRLAEYLTIWLCIRPDGWGCQDVAFFWDGRFRRIASRGRVLVAPQGFEPRLIGSEPTVLPLNEGA